VLSLLERLGFTLYAEALELRNGRGDRVLLEGLEEFREHLGGRLSIPMIRRPGDRFELHEMDPVMVNSAIDELRARSAGAGWSAPAA
jgi:3-dehydroquinate synthase